MTLGTMEDKTTSAVQQPSITIVQQSEEREENAGGKKSRVTQKHVIVGVTCALVVAMVITGVLVGVKFYLDSANEIVTRTFEFMDKVKEDVSVNVQENYVQYHMKNEGNELWVIEDFNRGLQMIKVTNSEGTKCFIATLNSSDSALPEAVLNATATGETLGESDQYYELSQTPIKEKSMLGRHGQKLCDNLDVHWLMRTCGAERNSTSSNAGPGRQKRRCGGGLIRVCWRCVRCYRYPYGWICRWGICCSVLGWPRTRYRADRIIAGCAY